MVHQDPFDEEEIHVKNFVGLVVGGLFVLGAPLGNGRTWDGPSPEDQTKRSGSQTLGGGMEAALVPLGFEDLVGQDSGRILAHVLHAVVEAC